MHGMSTVQKGEAVFLYLQRIQPFTALPELSSAELPVRNDETVKSLKTQK